MPDSGGHRNTLLSSYLRSSPPHAKRSSHNGQDVAMILSHSTASPPTVQATSAVSRRPCGLQSRFEWPRPAMPQMTSRDLDRLERKNASKERHDVDSTLIKTAAPIMSCCGCLLDEGGHHTPIGAESSNTHYSYGTSYCGGKRRAEGIGSFKTRSDDTPTQTKPNHPQKSKQVSSILDSLT